MIRNLVFLVIFVSGSALTLKSQPVFENTTPTNTPNYKTFYDDYAQLEAIVGTTEFRSLIFFARKIRGTINEIMEIKTEALEETPSTNLMGRQNWCFDLLRHLGLGHYFGLLNDDNGRILPVLLKLFPMAFLEGCVRKQAQDWEKVRALTQYAKLLRKIRGIFAHALVLCRPVDGFNSFFDSVLCCCPSLQKGATGELAQNLRKFLPPEIVKTIGETLEFMVGECDRQLDFIFTNYDPTFPSGIYQKRQPAAILRKIAENYQTFWLFAVPPEGLT